MAKQVNQIAISFKNNSKERKLLDALSNLEDRGNIIKQVLGEEFLPDIYKRKGSANKYAAKDKENETNNTDTDITNF